MGETVLSTCLGAVLGGLVSLGITVWQVNRQLHSARTAHLHNLQEELIANRAAISKAKSYLNGPPIDHALSPAAVIAESVQTSAWGDLVRSGALTKIDERDRRTLRLCDRAVRLFKTTVEEMAANMTRIAEWEARAVDLGSPQPPSSKAFLAVAFREIGDAAEYAEKMLSITMPRLDELLNRT